MVVQAGLYEVTFGFFTEKKPNVQMYVNGDIVLSAAGHNQYTYQKSAGTFSKHNNNVMGLTGVEYVSLPQKCRVSFSYNGDGAAEGFFGMKKL